VQEIAGLLKKQLGDFAPGQEEIIQLMGQLHRADLIETDALINTEALFERQAHLKQTKLTQRFGNPISQKVPLWDPEAFLETHVDKVSWLFSPWMAAIWLFIVIYSVLQALSNWGKIASYFELNTLSPYNFLVLFLLYPLIKIGHELGHAFATKAKGGEVHEMGVNFLMFMPVPYVDVSSSGHFRNKYDRILVSAAGILVETFLAALGCLLFLNTETGMIQAVGFNMMLTGGVSSLFFNGNPLLKYDGYYIVADALGIPNLYQRSLQYWNYFFQRYLFGMTQMVSPAIADGETIWFIIYSLTSLLYRLSILWFICVYVTDKFFTLGVLLALWLVSQQVLMPLFKAARFLMTSTSMGNKKKQAATITFLLIIGILGIFSFMPIPSYTIAEGIVWLPDESQIKADQDGFIGEIRVQSNQLLESGQVVLTMSDDTLETHLRVARAKIAELQSNYRAERQKDLVDAEILKEELKVAQAEYKNDLIKMAAMMVKTSKAGQVLLPEIDDLPGRYIHKGELIGYLLDDHPPIIRMALTQDAIGQFRERVIDVKVRLANALQQEYEATIIRQAPETSNKLPSEALSTIGGGKIAVDPSNKEALVTLQNIFLVDLILNAKNHNSPVGTRAFIRINHGGEPLSVQFYRRIRQAFLRQFNV